MELILLKPKTKCTCFQCKYAIQFTMLAIFSAIPWRLKGIKGNYGEGFWIRADFLYEFRW